MDGDTLRVSDLRYAVGDGEASYTRPEGLALSADGHTLTLDPEVVQDTVGILFKQREDIAAITPLLNDLLAPAPPAL